MNTQELIDKLRTAGESGSAMPPLPFNILLEAADALMRLKMIVDHLPETADGVPIVPGMMLWNHNGQVGFRVHTFGGDNGKGGCFWYSSIGDCAVYEPVYSTCDAAKAAHNRNLHTAHQDTEERK